MDSFEELLKTISACSVEQKLRIFSAIRDARVVHELEQQWNVRADVILAAISRGSDLTHRGIRGVIAESIFALDIVPTLVGWRDTTPEGNLAYDVALSKENKTVRIQVKMQRREKGTPKVLKDGSFVVEIQRTRTGTKGIAKTRPYRFGEFDLIAVCMEASTKDWSKFMYAPAAALKPDQRDKSIIETMQAVPPFTNESVHVWTGDLARTLEKF